MSQIFFFFFFWGGGGGGGTEACCPGKIRVLVTLRYRKVDLILTNNLKQQRTTNNNGANVPRSTRDYCNLFALAFELALFRFATPR